MKIKDIEIKWLGHSGFFIKDLITSKIIYIDPYNLRTVSNTEKADFVLITHDHYDHCSMADIEKVIKEGTRMIIPPDCQSKIAKFKIPVNIKVIEPEQELDYGSFKISTLPAYNVDKPFHPKEESWNGYLIKTNNLLIYHAGDTDVIPEMQKLTGYKQKYKDFIALLPVGGRFTMTAEEAAKAASIIKPSVAIPMHYGSIVGEKGDAEEFVQLCKEEGINAMILDKE